MTDKEKLEIGIIVKSREIETALFQNVNIRYKSSPSAPSTHQCPS